MKAIDLFRRYATLCQTREAEAGFHRCFKFYR